MQTNLLFALLSLIPWTIALCYIGVPQIYKLMGGSFGFFALYPALLLLVPKFPDYNKMLWLIILTMFGLIGTNCIYSYLELSEQNIPILLYLLTIVIPISWIITGFMGSIETHLKHQEFLKHKKLRDLYIYSLLVLLIPFYTFVIILVARMESHAMQHDIILVLGAVITSAVLLLIETRNISSDDIWIVLAHNKKPKISISRVRKYFTVGIIFIIFFSSYWEIYRGKWIVWSETAVIFFLYACFQYRFAEIFFAPLSTLPDEQSMSNIPSIKNRRSIVTGLLFLTIYILLSIFT